MKFSKLSRFVKNGPNELKFGMLSFLKDAHEHAKCHQNRRGGGKKLSGLAWNDPKTFINDEGVARTAAVF